MQTVFTLPLQSGRLKENQGAVALRTAMIREARNHFVGLMKQP